MFNYVKPDVYWYCSAHPIDMSYRSRQGELTWAHATSAQAHVTLESAVTHVVESMPLEQKNRIIYDLQFSHVQ